ncbi:MAG: DUF6552 family protein [Candidatus Actinomarinaceae bacterium]
MNLTFLKWTSSIILSTGLFFTSYNIYPLNLYVQLVGVAGWLWVGFIWKDNSVIFINGVGFIILLNGIIYSL